MPASGSTLPRAPQRVFGQADRRSTGWRVGRHPIAESALGWATRTDAEFDEVRADRKERCECLATRDFGGTDRDLALLARSACRRTCWLVDDASAPTLTTSVSESAPAVGGSKPRATQPGGPHVPPQCPADRDRAAAAGPRECRGRPAGAQGRGAVPGFPPHRGPVGRPLAPVRAGRDSRPVQPPALQAVGAAVAHCRRARQQSGNDLDPDSHSR
jgi:hypothetical protein